MLDDETDEVIYLLQGRSSLLRGEIWSTLASGTEKQVENQRRYWLERAYRNLERHKVGVIDEVRIVRVVRTFGPVTKLYATNPAAEGEDGGERRQPRRIAPSEE